MRIGLDIETNLAHDKIWLVKTIDLDNLQGAAWLSSARAVR